MHISAILTDIIIDHVERMAIPESKRLALYAGVVQRAYHVDPFSDEHKGNVNAYGETPAVIARIMAARDRGMPSLGQIVDFLQSIGRDPMRGICR